MLHPGDLRGCVIRKFSMFAALAAGGALASVPVHAQDLVHEPISQTFGGNPFNSNHNHGPANAHNEHPDHPPTRTSKQEHTLTHNTQIHLFPLLYSTNKQ